MRSDPPPDTLDATAIADYARTTALAQVASELRHDLATILHIVRSASETCTRGDIVTARRRLATVERRLADVDALLASHQGMSRGDTRVVDLARMLTGPYRTASGVAVDVHVAAAAEAVELDVPRSVLSLATSELVALLAPGPVRASIAVEARLARVELATSGDPSPPDWRRHWVEHALARHGVTLTARPAGYVLELPLAGPA